MKYQAIIFDLDGVICHTDQYHFKAWSELAEYIGAPFNQEINNKLRGVSRQDSLDIILQGAEAIYNDQEKKELSDRKNLRYQVLLQDMSPKDLDPQVEYVLKIVKEKGIKVAIGSSSKNAKLILGRLGIEDAFDAISDGNNIKRAKPDPEIFLNAAESLGVEPAECLVVEDARSGVMAAKAGGMDSAAIGDAVKYGLATYNLDSIKNLINLLDD
jgi:beta-phosphoglucomutase